MFAAYAVAHVVVGAIIARNRRPTVSEAIIDMVKFAVAVIQGALVCFRADNWQRPSDDLTLLAVARSPASPRDRAAALVVLSH